ncbi:MAG: SpaA isopeptide-forming pilin-related protein, partial [Thermomicrobiales bacterium]
MTDVQFTLQTETEDVATALSDSSGLVVFDDVVPGTYGISETLPPGYGEPVVMCYQTSAEGIVQEGPKDIYFGNQIRFDATVGGFLECSWYNIPATGADDGPNIVIQARSCGVGVTIADDLLLADAELLCPDIRPGREFIVRLDGERVGAAAANSPERQVFFTKLPVPEGGGNYVIEEILDSREETLRVFCDLGTGDGSFTIVPATLERNGVIYQSLNAGETLRCSWFSTEAIMSTVPASGGEPRIEVNLRLCGPDVDLVNDDLLAECEEIPENIVFQIAFEAQLVDEPIPDANDFFEINTSIGPGTFELKSLPIVGLSDPRYRCLIAPGDGSSEEITGTVPSDSPGLALPVEGNEFIFCYFFYQNIAEDQAADEAVDEEAGVTPGITVLVKLCPPDTAELRVDITEYCNYPGPNITFDVTIYGEPFNSQTTGENGQIDV